MAEFCNSCGRSLTEQATEAEDDIHDSILRNPASLKRFVTRLEDKIAKGENCSVTSHDFPYRLPVRPSQIPLPYTKININVKVGVPNEEFGRRSGY